MSTHDQDFEVGYGKPPQNTRFPKGRSGNPGGRPKGSRNFATDLDEALDAKLPITENGRRKTISGQLAALLRLREKALKGDARALDRYLALAEARSDEREARSAERNLTSGENEILARFEADILAQASNTMPNASADVLQTQPPSPGSLVQDEPDAAFSDLCASAALDETGNEL